MARTERKELRLTAEMSERVDKARGDVSFNRFVERALERAVRDLEAFAAAHDGPWPAASATATSIDIVPQSRASEWSKDPRSLAMQRQQRLNKGKKT